MWDWLRRALFNRHDPEIDELIRQKGARSLPGMEAMDWRKMDRAGHVRWARTVRAQRRTTQKVVPIARG